MTKRRERVSELEGHLGYWMRFVSNHVSHAFRLKVETRGVTVAEWAVLRRLFGAESTNPSQLADQLGMTRGAISKLVDRLLSKGLVERKAGTGDRRYQTLTLAPAGDLLVPELARLADENDREFFGHLDDGRKTELLSVLMELVDHFGWKDVPVE